MYSNVQIKITQIQCCVIQKQWWKRIQYYVKPILSRIVWPIEQLHWMNKKYDPRVGTTCNFSPKFLFGNLFRLKWLNFQNGAQAWYVPECTPDGRYQRIQCYRSAGYCWCVHEDTGKNIPGTSIKDGRPDCAINISRPMPMKGCPEPRKLEFLKELKEFLRIQIASTAANRYCCGATDFV